MGGWDGYGASETYIYKIICEDISKDAIGLGNFNALDWWIWSSMFVRCSCAISNDSDYKNHKGAGNYKVWGSAFIDNGCDFWIGNAGSFSFRDNYSLRAGLWLGAGFSANNGQVSAIN